MRICRFAVLLPSLCAGITVAGCASPPPVVVERTRVVHVETTTPAAADSGRQAPMRRDIAALTDWQAQLAGMESRIDERGLVVRFGDAAFEPGRPDPSSATQHQLDHMARVLGRPGAAAIDVVAYGDDSGGMLARGQAVRDYLQDRGLDAVRMDADPVRAPDGHIEVVIRER